MIQLLDKSSDGVLGFKLSGKLTDEDYQQFLPAVEALIERHGRIGLLVMFVDFEGWDIGALWEDLKFAAKHVDDVERIALLGDGALQKWMSKICAPFTFAEVKNFRLAEDAAAWQWVRERDWSGVKD